MSARTVAVIGCGSIGMRHIRYLCSLPRTRVVACDIDAARRALAEDVGAAAVSAIPQLAAHGPTHAFVCTSAERHVADTLWALEADCDVFVEKPLALDSAGAETILDAARRKGRRIAVGYMLRFDRGLQLMRKAVRHGEVGRVRSATVAFGQYLPDWRPGRDYRQTPSARKEQGGGVLLEASHEIDLVLWLFGDVAAVRAGSYRLSGLDIDVEDTVAAIIELADGPVVELHLDLIERGYRRDIRVVADRGLLRWDLKRGAAASRPDGAEVWREARCDVEALYRDEVDAFLSDRGEGASGVDGLRVMRVIDAIRASSDGGRMVRLA